MAQPTFGLTITQFDNEPRPAVAADLSTIGLVVTAPEANVATYPANTPVLINSSDDVAVAALGGTGTIRHQIDLINAQLSGFAASARIVIVRVDEGVDDDATMVNLIEGIAALEDAESMLGVAPRLIAVPGYTHQQATPATANPVVAALTGTLERLLGVAFITGPHDSLQGYIDWRETFSSDRLIPVETWVKAGVNPDTVDSGVVRDAAEAAAHQYANDMHRLGYDVTISGLHRALHQPGVQRVEITQPAATIVNDASEAAFCTGVTVTYEGIDV
jgi:phage tail sheath protein FI